MVGKKGSYSSNVMRGFGLCLLAFLMSANNCLPIEPPTVYELNVSGTPANWCAGDDFTLAWEVTPEERPVKVFAATGPAPSSDDYVELISFDAGSSPKLIEWDDLALFVDEDVQSIHVRMEVIPPTGDEGGEKTVSLHRIIEDQDYPRDLNFSQSSQGDPPIHTYVYTFNDAGSPQASVSPRALVKKVTLDSVRSVLCGSGNRDFRWRVQNGGLDGIDETLGPFNDWSRDLDGGVPIDVAGTGDRSWNFVLENGSRKEDCPGLDWVASDTGGACSYQVTFTLGCREWATRTYLLKTLL